MRKIFGGAMLFSALGAVILGGALAWNSSEVSGINNIDVMSIEFDMTYIQDPNAILGPNDGVHRRIGGVWIQNDGESNLLYNTGALEILTVDINQNGVQDDEGICAPANFGGSLEPTLALSATTGGLPPDNDAEPLSDPAHLVVRGAVATNAPDGCQGAEVWYRVVVVMTAGTPEAPAP